MRSFQKHLFSQLYATIMQDIQHIGSGGGVLIKKFSLFHIRT